MADIGLATMYNYSDVLYIPYLKLFKYQKQLANNFELKNATLQITKLRCLQKESSANTTFFMKVNNTDSFDKITKIETYLNIFQL